MVRRLRRSIVKAKLTQLVVCACALRLGLEIEDKGQLGELSAPKKASRLLFLLMWSGSADVGCCGITLIGSPHRVVSGIRREADRGLQGGRKNVLDGWRNICAYKGKLQGVAWPI